MSDAPAVDDSAIIAEWQAAFAAAAGHDARLQKSEFVKLLGVRDAVLAGRLFARFDRDGEGSVDRDEFINALKQLTRRTDEEKLRFAFELHDFDGSGGIDRRELAEFMRANLRENRLEFTDTQVDQLVDRFFKRVDTDGSGDISFDELRSAFGRYPDLLKSLAVSPLSWLRPHRPEPTATPATPRRRLRLSNHLARVIILALYVGITAWLCWQAVQRYAASGLFIQIARGSAAVVYLNAALIFIPMMRNLLTALRRLRAMRLIPFDDAMEFHKLCGHVMFAAAAVHTVAHLVNRPAVVFSPAGLSGAALLAVFAGMWITALPAVRRGGYFRLFFLAHFGYLAFVVLALLHGPRFWQWLLVPFAGFMLERLWRLRRSSAAVHIISGKLLPSNVLALELEKPPGFTFRPGGYLYLKCPQVSAFEWHPFTISSAPEEAALSVHIRAAGSWTGAIYDLIKERPSEASAMLDGPYGAPAEEIFSVKRAVLIGAGIGVTPFASVLRSILLRRKAGDTTLSLGKVHFFWLSREQRSFEWFLHLLGELENEPSFELNVYLTGAESRTDLKSATLFIAMDMLHEETKVNLITGLHSKTNTGRPEWPAIFRRIVAESGDEHPTVFFCGPPGLGRELKALCREHGLTFRQEVF